MMSGARSQWATRCTSRSRSSQTCWRRRSRISPQRSVRTERDWSFVIERGRSFLGSHYCSFRHLFNRELAAGCLDFYHKPVKTARRKLTFLWGMGWLLFSPSTRAIIEVVVWVFGQSLGSAYAVGDMSIP